MAEQKHEYNFICRMETTLRSSWHNLCFNVSNIIVVGMGRKVELMFLLVHKQLWCVLLDSK